MRVIKSSAVKYESFANTLPLISRTGEEQNLKLVDLTEMDKPSEDKPVDEKPVVEELFEEKTAQETTSFLSNELAEFGEKIFYLNAPGEIKKCLVSFIKKYVEIKKAGFNTFDIKKNSFVSLSEDNNPEAVQYFNRIFRDGILDWVIESRKPRFIPDYKLYSQSGLKKGYLIFPLVEDRKFRTFFSIYTVQSNDFEKNLKLIEFFVKIAFTKINLIKKESELRTAYGSIQTMQSKLSNDSRLSMLGEITQGFTEEILSPLQAISMQIDLLKENDGNLTDSIGIIKSQMGKVRSSVSRLLRFAERNIPELKLCSCSLNSKIKEYHDLILSSIRSNGFECVLDLDKNCPPILSHPDYLNQIFGILFNLGKNYGGGACIQTKYADESVCLRFLFTGTLESRNKPDYENDIRLLNNLVARHEGTIKISRQTEKEKFAGTNIVISFPLKRRIRE